MRDSIKNLLRAFGQDWRVGKYFSALFFFILTVVIWLVGAATAIYGLWNLFHPSTVITHESYTSTQTISLYPFPGASPVLNLNSSGIMYPSPFGTHFINGTPDLANSIGLVLNPKLNLNSDSKGAGAFIESAESDMYRFEMGSTTATEMTIRSLGKTFKVRLLYSTKTDNNYLYTFGVQEQ